MLEDQQSAPEGGTFVSVLPFLFFIALFFGISVSAGDFYAVPVLIAFTLTAVFAFVLYRKRGLEENIRSFCAGAGDSNVILMVLIFLLAGCFGALAKDIGAVSAVVNFCLSYAPTQALVGGIFLVCCFISLAMGSSMGTVIAIAPIAVGLSHETGLSVALLLGAVLGGAMFGDNLSSISDTTIAAVRTQGCELGDKFRQNFLIVAPAALLTLLIYALFPSSAVSLSRPAAGEGFAIIKMLPYVLVLGGALLRVNVLLLLFSGIGLSAIIGLAGGSFGLVGLFKTVHRGMVDMEDLSILALVAAGTSQLIKDNGGLAYILRGILTKVETRRGSEYGIALLASLADLVTANNTIAIVVAGPIARDIADKFGIAGKRTASLLDLFASAFQGLIPYGAQILSAVSFAHISPIELVPYNIYCFLTITTGLAAIHWDLPRAFARPALAASAKKAEAPARTRRARTDRSLEEGLGLQESLPG